MGLLALFADPPFGPPKSVFSPGHARESKSTSFAVVCRLRPLLSCLPLCKPPRFVYAMPLFSPFLPLSWIRRPRALTAFMKGVTHSSSSFPLRRHLLCFCLVVASDLPCIPTSSCCVHSNSPVLSTHLDPRTHRP
jgi:hypothetical protein